MLGRRRFELFEDLFIAREYTFNIRSSRFIILRDAISS